MVFFFKLSILNSTSKMFLFLLFFSGFLIFRFHIMTFFKFVQVLRLALLKPPTYWIFGFLLLTNS